MERIAIDPEFIKGVVATLISFGLITALALMVLGLIGIHELYTRRRRIVETLVANPFLRLRVRVMNLLVMRVEVMDLIVLPWAVTKKAVIFVTKACLALCLTIVVFSILPGLLMLLINTPATISAKVPIIMGIMVTGAVGGILVAPYVTYKYRRKEVLRVIALYLGTILAGSQAAVGAVIFFIAIGSD